MGRWMLRAKPLYLSSKLTSLPDNWTPLPEVDYVQISVYPSPSIDHTNSPVKCLNFASSFGPERIS